MRSLFRSFATRAQNRQETRVTSPIGLILNPRTESLGPACCATPALSPQAKMRRTAAYLIKQQVPDCCWQLLFCKRLRVPTPRHASLPPAIPSKP